MPNFNTRPIVGICRQLDVALLLRARCVEHDDQQLKLCRALSQLQQANHNRTAVVSVKERVRGGVAFTVSQQSPASQQKARGRNVRVGGALQSDAPHRRMLLRQVVCVSVSAPHYRNPVQIEEYMPSVRVQKGKKNVWSESGDRRFRIRILELASPPNETEETVVK